MAGVLLFDGVCNLCNGAVQFVLDRERDAGALKFAPLQSDVALQLLTDAVGDEEARAIVGGADGPRSMVLVEDGKVYVRSTGALRVARKLRWPWRWGYAFLLVPRFVRDAVYDFVGTHRYRWFGKSETCRVPTPDLRARFLA